MARMPSRLCINTLNITVASILAAAPIGFIVVSCNPRVTFPPVLFKYGKILNLSSDKEVLGTVLPSTLISSDVGTTFLLQ
jgi:hypothetical protein